MASRSERDAVPAGDREGSDQKPAGAEKASAARRRRILAVVNPVSGLYPQDRTVRELRDRARKMDLELDVVLTRQDLDGEAAIRLQGGEYDCYLAVGGDGTVMEVATAAIRNGVPMAILPRGTANAVAWHFRIPIEEGHALKVAAEGTPLQVDVARTTQREFLIMAGLGYDAHVIEAATRELKKRLGFLAYLFAALKQLRRRSHVFRIYLDDDDPILVSGATAVVTNTGTLAGNLRLLPDVSPLDGLMDVVVISPENFGSFFRMVLLGMVGRLGRDPRVKTWRARRVRIQCRPAAPLEIDGDSMGIQRELQAEVLPKALTLMVLSEGMPWFPWGEKLWPGGGAFPWSKSARAKKAAPAGSSPKTPVEPVPE